MSPEEAFAEIATAVECLKEACTSALKTLVTEAHRDQRSDDYKQNTRNLFMRLWWVLFALNRVFLSNVLAARLDPSRSTPERQASDSAQFTAIKQSILSTEQLLLPIVLS